jgi:hypothetical protein
MVSTETITYNALISILFGSVAGALVSIIYSTYRSRKEYQSLLLVFCIESVHAFKRCVSAHKLSMKGEVSKGKLFDFTDSTALSRLASVCNDPKVIAAIFEVKSFFFQINRHLEEASLLAVDYERADPDSVEKLAHSAMKAQNTALGFFKSSYSKIEKNIEIILNEARKTNSKSILSSTEDIFLTAIKEWKKL